jgi:CRP/FNR family transcriptional regulator, cyclic AMP receptor protein
MAVDKEILKTISYFTDLDDAYLERIKGFMLERKVDKGAIILSEGEWSDYLYFVVSGLVKVYKTSIGGKEQILHIAPPGDSLNDVSTFDGGPSTASMLTMTPVHYYAIRKEDLRGAFGDPPRVWLNVVKSLANRIRRDAKLVEELSTTQTLARLAKLLLGRYAGEEATTGLMLNQQDMADLIGASREVVNRALKTMEDKGAITLHRHRVVVADRNILSKLARKAGETTPEYMQPD